jgi:hypothetical protein
VSTNGTRLLVPMKALPDAIAESVRAVLHVHGLHLSDELLREIGNNTAQIIVSLDESGEE